MPSRSCCVRIGTSWCLIRPNVPGASRSGCTLIAGEVNRPSSYERKPDCGKNPSSPAVVGIIPVLPGHPPHSACIKNRPTTAPTDSSTLAVMTMPPVGPVMRAMNLRELLIPIVGPVAQQDCIQSHVIRTTPVSLPTTRSCHREGSCRRSGRAAPPAPFSVTACPSAG